jgi:tetratricopeptide (TPR) repeat protein
MEKAVAWDSGSPPFRHELALLFSTLGRPTDAIVQLIAACRLAPRDAEMRYQLGLAYNEAGDLQHTADELQTAVTLDPRHAAAWYNLGLARNELGDPAAALEALLRSESIDLNQPRIPYARATILARLGRNREAEAAVRRTLELHPGYPEARDLLQTLTRQ